MITRGLDWNKIADTATHTWDTYGDRIILTVGTILVGVIVWQLWRFWRAPDRSRRVSIAAAVLTMAWTSEGLLTTAIEDWHVPAVFAGFAFVVFEALLLAAALRAEEVRNRTGHPGPAGVYAFVIAFAQGAVAASGADTAGEVLLRLLLPPLAVGLWYLLLIGERDTDTDAIRQARDQRREDWHATWTVSWRTPFIWIGWMRIGKSSLNKEDQARKARRLGHLALKIAASQAKGAVPVRQARRLTRWVLDADPAVVQEAQTRVRRAVNAVDLLVPPNPTPRSAGSGPHPPHAVRTHRRGPDPGSNPTILEGLDRVRQEWAGQLGPQGPDPRVHGSNGSGPEDDPAPVSPAPAGRPLVDPDTLAALVARADQLLPADVPPSGGKVFDLNIPGCRKKAVANLVADHLRRLRTTRTTAPDTPDQGTA